MASLTLTGDNGGFTWKISGLDNPFTSGNYRRVGITMNRFTVGGVSSISGIIDYKNAGSGGTSVSKYISYTPGTYDFWGFAETPLGGYWPCGSDRVKVEGGGGPSPSDFDWDYAGRDPNTGALVSGATKQRGLVAYISASEWNNLVDAVNQRTGAGLSHVSRGMVASSAATVNPVARALGVSTVSAGSSGFSASFFNDLRRAVNQW